MALSYSGYYTGLSSWISGFDSPQSRQTYWVRLSVRTVAFQVAKTGSIPVLSTITIRKGVGGWTNYQALASHMLVL